MEIVRAILTTLMRLTPYLTLEMFYCKLDFLGDLPSLFFIIRLVSHPVEEVRVGVYECLFEFLQTQVGFRRICFIFKD